MNKSSIITSLTKNYDEFINYINSLSPEDYDYRFEQKWTAAEHLEHIVLCIKPLLRALSMDKLALEQNFGLSGRSSKSYEAILNKYLAKLNEGGKAPERYVPSSEEPVQKETLIGRLSNMLADLYSRIESFSEEELDSLMLPHPLLRNITLREMLYNTIYHVVHHHEQAKEHLAQRIK